MSKVSRPVNVINLVPPDSPTATGVYNFFTPDERTNETTGGKYVGAEFGPESEVLPINSEDTTKILYIKDGKSYREENIRGIVPRYNQITVPPKDFLLYQNSDIVLEEAAVEGHINESSAMYSPYDINVEFADVDNPKRVKRKFNALAKILGFNSANDSITLDLTLNTLGLNQSKKQFLRELIDLNSAPEAEEINDITVSSVPYPFEEVQESFFDLNLNRNLMKEIVTSTSQKDVFFSTVYKRYLDDNPSPLLPHEGSDVLEDITLNGILSRTTRNDPFYSEKHLGYIVERFSNLDNILTDSPERTFYMNSSGGTLLDTEVLYGKNYMYTLKDVYVIEYASPSGFGGAAPSEFTTKVLIASPRSAPTSVKVVDQTPPKEPDGLFYRYDHQKKSLILTWQYPVGTKRDIKYYQIFRRKTINEPFACIAELDFDNSFLKSPKREKVRDERVIKKEGPIGLYYDSEFDVGGEYIYAVAAVDAHGLTSGYSAQSRVKYDPSLNELILNTVSQPGAPKQYPNFFVDPVESRQFYTNNLTQDAIRTSGFSGINIYFDPDAAIVKVNDGTGVPTAVYPTKEGGEQHPQGVFKLSFIDLDRQKTKNLELEIRDVRGTGIFS